MPDGVRIGVVGAASLVGREVVTALGDRAVTVSQLSLLSIDPEDEGSLAEGIGEPSFIKLLNREELESLDVVIFCGPSSDAREWVDASDEIGFIAIDATDRDSRVEGELVIAGLNDLPSSPSSIVSPHALTVASGLVIHALSRVAEIERYRISAILPASERGQEGIDEMYQQTLAVLNVQSPPREVFAQQVAFNLYTPEVTSFLEGEISNELSKLFSIPGSVMIQQGAMFHNHSISIFFELDDSVDEYVLRDALAESPGIVYREPEELAGTTDAGGLDEIVVGRASVDPQNPAEVLVQIYSDNLRRARALNVAMIVEELFNGSMLAN